MQRVTRQVAATRLNVSEATVDRMIRRGELATEQEPQGSRYRVWVLLDDHIVTALAENGAYTGAENADKTVETSADGADRSVDTGANDAYTNEAVLIGLKADVKRWQELAEYRAELLKDSEWRFQEVLQQLKQSQENVGMLTRALPPPTQEPEAEESVSAKRRRWRWWPFGRK